MEKAITPTGTGKHFALLSGRQRGGEQSKLSLYPTLIDLKRAETFLGIKQKISLTSDTTNQMRRSASSLLAELLPPTSRIE